MHPASCSLAKGTEKVTVRQLASGTDHADLSESPINLATAEIFRETSPEALLALEARAQRRSLVIGETIPSGGTADGECVYIVLDGRIGIYSLMNANERLLLAEIERGGSFGEFSVINGKGGVASAEALAPTLVAQIPGDVFLAFLSTHPTASFRLLQKLVRLVQALNVRVTKLEALDESTTMIYHQLMRLTA
jgi:CRP-like cAMP-binding protein